jgi:ferredoxin-like protein FixX
LDDPDTFECGTCLVVAAPGTLTWHYPRSGMGVTDREW